MGYTTELTSTEPSIKWWARQQLAEELKTDKTQEWTQLRSQRDAGIHSLSWKWSVCAYFEGHQVCWKTTASNITVVSTGPWKLFQRLCCTPCQKWARLQRHLRTTPCVWSSKNNGVYSFLQSRHLREKVTFFHPVAIQELQNVQMHSKEKKIWWQLYTYELGLWRYI